ECAQRRVVRLPHEPAPLQVPLRPTWLLPRPVPLRDAHVRLLAGPERIEAGWWDGGDVRRDYWVVETGQGQRAWVYCAAGERGPWMLHGWFA
ncbi:MAG TPA: DNA polymerase Y family protein, partial [Rhodanobacteraceae bacterium]|nr:DNA polymerase Y family protein [Rhodanobacteraceae bacterium]